MDKQIYTSVCQKEGHHIASVRESVTDQSGQVKVTNLGSGAVATKEYVICTRCGATPPFKEVAPSRPRKAKAQAGPAEAQPGLSSLD